MTCNPGRTALTLLACGAALLLFVEWHTDEPLVVLPVLIVISFCLGLAAPLHGLLTGMVLGWSILLAHALSNATGSLIPRYQHAPPTAADWIAMTLLVLPAVVASVAGAFSRRIATKPA